MDLTGKRVIFIGGCNYYEEGLIEKIKISEDNEIVMDINVDGVIYQNVIIASILNIYTD